MNAFQNLTRCKITSIESITPPFVLPAGQTIQLATLEFDDSIESMDEYLEENLRLAINYKSLYAESLRFDSTS